MEEEGCEKCGEDQKGSVSASIESQFQFTPDFSEQK